MKYSAVICDRCGKENPPDSKFCNECGNNLTKARGIPSPPEDFINKIEREKKKLSGSRRRVAVMFADLSGFTSLSERMDPEDVMNLMNSLFERFGRIIYKYEGYIDKYIGDCVMVLFGAPVSHEDDALRAVLCGVELINEVKKFERNEVYKFSRDIKLSLSVGINFGEVVAGNVGYSQRMQYTVMGDTVNLAERLQEASFPDEIYVSEAIYELTRREIEYKEIPPILLKGKVMPVRVYKVEGVKSRYVIRHIQETPMVDREAELRALMNLYRLVLNGEPQVVLIKGEAGVGKTKLVYEFIRRIMIEEPFIIEVRGVEYLSSAEGWVFRDFMRKLMGIGDRDGKEVISYKVDEFLKRFSVDLKLLPLLIKWFLRGEMDENERIRIEGLKSDFREHILVRFIRGIIKRAGKDKPFIIFFDDVQWIDETSRRYTEKIMKDIVDARVMVLFTKRGEDDLNLREIKNYHKMVVEPFTEIHTEELIKVLLSSEYIDDRLREVLMEYTRGNPLHIEEFTSMLRLKYKIEVKNGKAYLGEEISDIPVSIERLVLVRFDALSEREKTVLRVASIIGDEFEVDVIGRVLSEHYLKFILRDMEDKGFVETISDYGDTGKKYRFRHGIIREVIYNTVLKKERMEYHRRIGRIMEDVYKDNIEDYYDIILYHYREAEDEDRYIYYLLKTAEKEYKGGSYKSAERLYEEWISHKRYIYGDREDIETLLKVVNLKNDLAMYDEALEILRNIEEKREITFDDELEMRFMLNKGEILFSKGMYDEAFEMAERCMLFVEYKKIDDKTITDVYSFYGNSLMSRGEYDKALEYYRKSLEIRIKVFGESHPDVAVSYNNIGLIYANKGEYGKALEYFKKALEIRIKVFGENHPTTAHSYVNIGNVYLNRGEYDKALEYYKKSLEIRIKVFGESHPDVAASCNSIGVVYVKRGEYDKAVEYYKRAREISREVFGENHPKIAEILYNLAELYYQLGNTDEGYRFISKVIKIGEEKLGRSNINTGRAYLLLSKIFIAQKRYEEARSYLEMAYRIAMEKHDEEMLEDIRKTGKSLKI